MWNLTAAAAIATLALLYSPWCDAQTPSSGLTPRSPEQFSTPSDVLRAEREAAAAVRAQINAAPFGGDESSWVAVTIDRYDELTRAWETMHPFGARLAFPKRDDYSIQIPTSLIAIAGAPAPSAVPYGFGTIGVAAGTYQNEALKQAEENLDAVLRRLGQFPISIQLNANQRVLDKTVSVLKAVAELCAKAACPSAKP